jgi:BirA family biotin operon repressor/biotin-[acetyl-CoA-carboxylase] ligase
VIVGVGINVNQGERTLFPEEIRDTATSLKLECGHAIDRSILIAMIMERFEDLYGRFTDSGDLAYLTDRYDELLVSRDREVRVLDPQGEYTGISRGIDDRGELLVETPDGEVHRVYAGEVSVRGLYGYV